MKTPQHILNKNKRWREANKEKFLATCKAYRDANKARAQETKAAYYQANKEKLNATAYVRSKRYRQAMLPGFNKQIETIYEIAKYLTRKTGVLHVVDHFWPLNGPTSCGLHVPWNLRVITQPANDTKGNKEPNHGFTFTS